MKMGFKYIISEEERIEIKEARKSVKNKMTDKRLHAVELRGEGKSNREIAEKLDTSPKVVSRWVSNYKKQGIEALLEKERTGNRWNISYEEETELLNEFEEKANKGQIVEISEIRAAYDKAVGHKTTPTHIYAVLKRHNWTKKMPRSRHPKKADEETIKVSRKLTTL